GRGDGKLSCQATAVFHRELDRPSRRAPDAYLFLALLKKDDALNLGRYRTQTQQLSEGLVSPIQLSQVGPSSAERHPAGALALAKDRRLWRYRHRPWQGSDRRDARSSLKSSDNFGGVLVTVDIGTPSIVVQPVWCKPSSCG